MRKLFSLLLLLFTALSLAAQNVPTKPEATVPRVNITLNDGIKLDVIHKDKNTYQKCMVEIKGNVGFPDMAASPCRMKGRGNSTWSGRAKRPYRLKFDRKVSPFGLPEGKSWVLLANFLDAAQLNNPVGMFIARQVGTVAANHIVPVELYVNGEYLGLYNFTEQVGIAANSVKATDEETCALLELDDYDGKENRENAYHLPLSVKDPDREDYEKLMTKKYKKLTGNKPDEATYVQENADRFYATINSEFSKLTEAVKFGKGEMNIDIPSLVRYFFVYDLIGNLEFLHPKSTYIHRQNIFDEKSPWVFGPVWDCDWAYGYEGTYQFCVSSPEFDAFHFVNTYKPGALFFRKLLRDDPTIREAYIALWKDYMKQGKLTEVLNYIDAYQKFILPATQRDYNRWVSANHKVLANYAPLAERMKSWLKGRANYIVETLENGSVSEHSLMIGEEGMATVYLPYDWRIPENMTVHRVKVLNAQRLDTKQVLSPGGVVAANTPVLVKAPQGEYLLKAAEGDYVADNLQNHTNHLMGLNTNGSLQAPSNFRYYILANDPKGGIGFYFQKGTQGKSVGNLKNHAFLSVSLNYAPTRGFSFDGTLNGIEVPVESAPNDSPIYDLSGRRVAQPKHGIYLQHGQKVIR